MIYQIVTSCFCWFIYTEEYIRKRHTRRDRCIFRRSSSLAWLDNYLSSSLKKTFPNCTNVGRIPQSMNDLIWRQNSNCVIDVDIHDCLPSCGVEQFVRYYKVSLSYFQIFLIRLIYNSKTNSDYTLGRLRPGLSSSSTIINIITSDLRKLKNKKNIRVQSFVDDITITCDRKEALDDYLQQVKIFLGQFGLKLHEQGEKNTGILCASQDGHLGGRLGLLFYRRNGRVYSKLRPATVRRYIYRIKLILRNSNSLKEALPAISEILFGNKDKKGLYQSFPKVIWNCPISRMCFKKRVYKLVKKRFPSECKSVDLNILFSGGSTLIAFCKCRSDRGGSMGAAHPI